MQARPDSLLRNLGWLVELGLDTSEVPHLNPCVPGEFTTANAIYVNAGSPRIIYQGTEEGTLPLVGGRWYLIPDEIVRRHPNLQRDTVPVARAARLLKST